MNGHQNQMEGHQNQMNCHQNQKQIGQNNHLHSYILSYWKNVQQNPITSKHYFSHSKNSSQTKPRVWKSVREKKGQASLKSSMNGHISGSGILRASFLLSVKNFNVIVAPPPKKKSLIIIQQKSFDERSNFFVKISLGS